jgi:hypothetical protein
MPNRKIWLVSVLVLLLVGISLFAWRSRSQRQNDSLKTTAPPDTSTVNKQSIPQDQTIAAPAYSIRMQGADKKSIYVFRLFTVGGLTNTGTSVRGQGFFPWDTKRRTVQFEMAGGEYYLIGLCQTGGLCDYANTIEKYSYSQLNARIPHNSLIQLKISPRRLSGVEENALKTAYEGGLTSNWRFDDVLLHPFEIDIIDNQ